MKIELFEDPVEVGSLSVSDTFVHGELFAVCMVANPPPKYDIPATAVFVVCLNNGATDVLDPKKLVQPFLAKVVPDGS